MMQRFWLIPLFTVVVFVMPRPAWTQSEDTTPSASPGETAVVAQAVRTARPPSLSGRLDDPAWDDAGAIETLTQARPDPGAPASERSEVRILYDDRALYIGARLYDSDPDEIVAPLARRDRQIRSDWLTISLDPHHDRRTGYVFMVNPRGVQRDLRITRDRQQDDSWDAVWESVTSIDEHGWIAEIRIPFSQLRFRERETEAGMTWGFNVARTIARKDELSHWSPTPPDAAGVVSSYGRLEGLANLRSPRHFSVRPYSLARLTRAPGDPDNPFHRSVDTGSSVGVDLTYGITSSLTLSATINPDFGQVEGDPATVNLSAFELFLQERRPFFTEGAEHFDVGWPPLLHSRRIGRTPQGRVPPHAVHHDRPEATRILGAAKLTGRVTDVWSVGLLTAVTAEETASYVDADGDRYTAAVEPQTHYSVARVRRSLREGETELGGIVTATRRSLGTDALREQLPHSAYTGGLDLTHRFGRNDYQLDATLLASHVEGAEPAIAQLQRSASRYFHRPDAEHLTYDPTRTELSGMQGRVELRKLGGGNLRGVARVIAHSPGFEVNDLGFDRASDLLSSSASLNYRQDQPGRHLRNWQIGASAAWNGNLALERQNLMGSLTGRLQLRQGWGGNFFVNRIAGGIDPVALRGGPALYTPPRSFLNLGLHSDRRRPVQLTSSLMYLRGDEERRRSINISSALTARVAYRLSLSISPNLVRNENPFQYVGRRTGDDGDIYLLGHLSQTTVSLAGRLNYTVSPTLSFELWFRPFMSAGAYSDFRMVTDPRATGFDERFYTFTDEELQTETLDRGRTRHSVVDGPEGTTGVSFLDPSFTRRDLQSNAVLRWEYRPGSTLYLVWSQNRHAQDFDGHLDMRQSIDRLVQAEGRHEIMLKIDYWLDI